MMRFDGPLMLARPGSTGGTSAQPDLPTAFGSPFGDLPAMDLDLLKEALANGEALPLDPQFLALLQTMVTGGNLLPVWGNGLPPHADEAASRPSDPAASVPGGDLLRLLTHRLTGSEGVAAIEGEGSRLEMSRVQLVAPPSVRLDLGLQPALARLPDVRFTGVLGDDAAPPPATLGSLTAAPASTLLRADRVDLALPPRMGEGQWAQALGERLLIMAGREQQVAELRLNPPHLGPLEVRLAVQQDQASVAFVTQHALVREALEQAIPRLREMLGQQDLQLVQVDVAQREAFEQHPGRRQGGAAAPVTPIGTENRDGDEPTGTPTSPVVSRAGLIDLFA